MTYGIYIKKITSLHDSVSLRDQRYNSTFINLFMNVFLCSNFEHIQDPFKKLRFARQTFRDLWLIGAFTKIGR